MSTLFVDESKSSGYTFAAAVVSPSSATPLRKAMRGLVLPGQRRLHFSRESDARRKAIVSRCVQLDIQVHILRSSSAREADAREECLVGLVALAEMHSYSTLILERDESIEMADKRILFLELGTRGLRNEVHYELRSPYDEPLLWIPDAIAWSYAKGGDWSRRIAPMVIDVTTV